VQHLLGDRWTGFTGTECHMLCSYCSVFDVDDERNPEEKKNGFVFDDANEGVSTLEEILKFSSKLHPLSIPILKHNQIC
jgi:hypothetical protein